LLEIDSFLSLDSHLLGLLKHQSQLNSLHFSLFSRNVA